VGQENANDTPEKWLQNGYKQNFSAKIMSAISSRKSLMSRNLHQVPATGIEPGDLLITN
jgi:hypothetical protein